MKPPFSDIKAFAPGMVIHAKMAMKGTGVGGYGITVIIKDSNNHFHLYAHWADCCVSVGQYIREGQVVGRQGSTGLSTGPHLHYEIRKSGIGYGYGKHVDPLNFLFRSSI